MSEVRHIKKSERAGQNCDTMNGSGMLMGVSVAPSQLEKLRDILQDARRRLNTLDEILERACSMTKE